MQNEMRGTDGDCAFIAIRDSDSVCAHGIPLRRNRARAVLEMGELQEAIF
jgi:hypothetical protein